MNYRRLMDESEIEYQYRISSLKDQIGSWQDVADIINAELGHEYTESKYRKDYASFIKMLEAHRKEVSSSNDEVESIKHATEELKKERYKLQATKIEDERYRRQDSRVELFFENLKDAIEALPSPEYNPAPVQKNNREYVLCLADLHYGASFNIPGNSYSRKICEYRLWNLLDQVKDYIKENGIQHLTVLELGDSVQGILRMTDLQLNEVPVVQAVVEISRLLGGFLNQLSEVCFVDYVHCSSANHTQTRPLGSKANELVGEDLEKVIVSYISDLLRNNNRVTVTSNLERDYVDFNIFDFLCAAAHGHKIRNFNTALKDLSVNNRRYYSYIFLGHFHEQTIIPSGTYDEHNLEVLVCPSFAGADPFSDSLMKSSKAAAKIFVFDEVYGHVGDELFILN